MNWTGGALSRSRNTNTKISLSAKQKNYFAKARVKAQKGRQPSPLEIQYFDFGKWKPESGVQDDRRSKPVKQRLSSQRTLDQFENVQGVVRKLRSLRPRTEGENKKRSLIDDTEGHVLPSGIPIPPISQISIGSQAPSDCSPVQASPTVKRSSKRHRTPTSSTSDELYPLAALESVEAKRRRLLQESDWVGVERQKVMSQPVTMRFTDAKDRDLIGRRRPLNDSAAQNRWNVQGSRRMKTPLIASYSERPRGLDRRLDDAYRGTEEISIRIGSAATKTGPNSEEILDSCQSPRLGQRPSHPVQAFDFADTGPTPNSQHRRRQVTTPSAFGDESSEPFRSLFSPEEVEQSGIAQLVEAATVADDYHFPLFEDELRLPDDYHFPKLEPGFRLVFEQTPQPRGQISEFNDSSSPIVRDFASNWGQVQGATVEDSIRSENRNVLEERVFEHVPVYDKQSGTSPLSIATSRYMQKLERQSLGPGGRGLFAKNTKDKAATESERPAANRNKAEERRGATSDQESKTSVQPNDFQGKDNIQPSEDEDAIWRKYTNLDDVNDFIESQEQPTSKHRPLATTAKASVHEPQVPDQSSLKSIAQSAPPQSPRDDELLWRNFIFSDIGPNDDWVIEERASPESPPSDDHISRYNPARTQPSMVAEAATSPVKQNPHLQDEMLDDSTIVLDGASRYANASTSSTGSPVTSEDVSCMPQHVPSYSSDSPPARPSFLAKPSPATFDNHSHSSSSPHSPNRNPRIHNPSSLIAEAPSSSIPTHSAQTLSPTNATNPSSDELSWTPSRLPTLPTRKEKVVFKKPSRYVGERASDALEPVHLGRKVNGRKGKKKMKKEEMSLAEAVERAKGKMGGKGRKESRDKGAEGDDGEEKDQDDIVDD